MAKWFDNLLQSLGLKSSPVKSVPSTPDMQQMKRMMGGIVSTRDDEIGCDDCFEQLDEYVERGLHGEDAGTLMPLVQDHLERCRDCNEEHGALMRALDMN